MQLLLTGMTRDGVYGIQGGKVTHAVKNCGSTKARSW
jgi:hypothetical protein